MKNLKFVVSLLVLVLSSSAWGQENNNPFTNTLQSLRGDAINIGVIPLIAASTSLDTFATSVNPGFLTYLQFKRTKSYTTFIYSAGNHSVAMINGVLLNEEGSHDIYVVTGKSLKSKGGYLGVGYEVFWQYALPFIEVGTDWSSFAAKDTYVSLGVIFPLYRTVWKK